MRAVYDRLTSSTDRVSYLRTYVPAVWAAIVYTVADVAGFDIPGTPLDTVGPLVLFASLYWIGKRFPKVEALLLGVAVESQAYTKRGVQDLDPQEMTSLETMRADAAAGLRDSMTVARFDPSEPDYVPLPVGRRPRSLDILEETARRMGADPFDYDALPVTLDPEGPA